MKKATPAEIATIAAILSSRPNFNLSNEDAIRWARQLVSLAASLPEAVFTCTPHQHPKNAFGYTGDNWRKRTLERISVLFNANIPPDGKTPPGARALTRLDNSGFDSPEQFLSYHERRGLEPWFADEIRDLVRRWKAERARIGSHSRK